MSQVVITAEGRRIIDPMSIFGSPELQEHLAAINRMNRIVLDTLLQESRPIHSQPDQGHDE